MKTRGTMAVSITASMKTTTRHLIPSIGERNFWIVIDLWCHPRHQKTVSQSFLWNRVTVDVPLSHVKPDSDEWSYSGHSEHSYTGRLTWPLSISNVHRWAVLLKQRKRSAAMYERVKKRRRSKTNRSPAPTPTPNNNNKQNTHNKTQQQQNTHT